LNFEERSFPLYWSSTIHNTNLIEKSLLNTAIFNLKAMHLSNFIIYSKYLTGRVCGFEERGYRDKNIRTAEIKLKFIKAIETILRRGAH